MQWHTVNANEICSYDAICLRFELFYHSHRCFCLPVWSTVCQPSTFLQFKDILTSQTTMLSFIIRMCQEDVHIHFNHTTTHTSTLAYYCHYLFSFLGLDTISFPIHRIYLQNLEPSHFAMPIEQLFKQKCYVQRTCYPQPLC